MGMIGLAKQSKSTEDFIEKIRETETLDITSSLSSFANELYQKIPRGGGSGGGQTMGQKRQIESRAREQAAKDLAAKNKSFQPILSDDEDSSSKPSKKKKKLKNPKPNIPHQKMN